MKCKNLINTIAISAIASTLLVGCGDNTANNSTSDTITSTISGVATDPELQGATVFLDENNNGLFDVGELSTITDNNGSYSLSVLSTSSAQALIVTGGTDKVTRAPFTDTMSAPVQDGDNIQNITPLTTLIQKYQATNSAKSIDEVKQEIASKLGLNVEDLTKNTALTGNEEILKVALRVHKIAKTVSASSNSKDIAEIYDTIAMQLQTNSTLSAAINNTITQEMTAGTLDEVKARDLDAELQRIDITKSPEAIALTVENIDEKVHSATTETELTADLSQNETVIVDTNEVYQEQSNRTIKELGLEGLDKSTQNALLNNREIDFTTQSNDDIQKKINNGNLDLSNTQRKDINQEQFFYTTGLNNLDDDTKNKLKINLDNNGFDYTKSSISDFQFTLEDANLYNGDDDFRAQVQGHNNQQELKEKLETSKNSSTVSLADGKLLVGSIIKGPIDGATIKLVDNTGKLISSTVSDKGIFAFPETVLTADGYYIESIGGKYDDEATKSEVIIDTTQGLKTYLTKDELTTILANKEYIAITPETTIYADLIKGGMEKETAKALVVKTMITTTSPLSLGEANDKFLTVGDFTSSFPKDQAEAFARNRAISFSYMVKDLNKNPNQVFEIMTLITDDLKDGTADGIDTNGDGTIDTDITSKFGLARTKLFQDTTTKLKNGELSDGQKIELNQMGIDTEKFSGNLSEKNTDLALSVTNHLASTTLPTLHNLPLLVDEDGNPTDAQATYTLTANTDVNVTIETPDGSWITPMWRYNNSPLPVVIRTNRNNDMTLNFVNKLTSDSTIHWHGFKIPSDMDGGPDVPIAADASKTYSFKMQQPAAPLWFHPHPDMQTGKQVYMGLAGVFLLEDEITKQLEANNELPSGDKDTILLVQDRRFAAEVNGVKELQYKTLQRDSDGMLGDTLLVNGSVVPKQEVTTEQHRYRLYNVSNARNYNFALSDGSEFTIVGTDGGLLNSPVKTTSIILGAAERVEIIIDFAKYSVGDKVMLVSNPTSGDMMSMMGDMNMGSNSNTMGNDVNMGSGSNTMGGSNMSNSNTGLISSTNQMESGNTEGVIANGAGFAVMRFDITSQKTDNITLYTSLPNQAEINSRLTEDDALNKGNEREFLMSMSMQGDTGAMSFVINGKTFKADRVDEYIASGATEIWNIKNMSPMAHPFHAHAIQYQILDRNGVPASGTDLGWKDTFLVQPGESVRIIGKFDGTINYGDYMYHCHILEHEDAGMMGYFRVGESGNLDNKVD